LYLLIFPSGGSLFIPQSGAIYSSVSGALLNSGDNTALIIPGIGENWCRFMQRRTFAYQYLAYQYLAYPYGV